jgi:IS5 family transposase
VVVDTTVQPGPAPAKAGAIAHPTDARLCHRALDKLVDLAERNGVRLRQSYRRVAKRAAIMVGATPTRISSSGHGENSSSCAPGWAG